MDHKMLYKDLRSQTPNHKLLNRKLQEAHRSQKRRDRFQNSRNLPASPVRQILIPLGAERLAKLGCHSDNPEKLNKQEDFLKRFIKWKENKNMKLQQEVTNKKKPFVSAVSNSGPSTYSCSIVPIGHHKGFRPPNGLKNPIKNENKEDDKSLTKGRESIYTVVPTPPRKTKQTADAKPKSNFPIVRKALPTNLHTKIVNSNKTAKTARTTNLAKNSSKPKNKLKNKATGDNQKPLLKIKRTSTKVSVTTATATQPIRMERKVAATTARAKPSNRTEIKVPVTTTTTAKPPITFNLRPCNLKMPPPPLSKNRNSEAFEDMLLQTPKDFTLNPFQQLVTSTKIKDSSQNPEGTECITPTECSLKKLHNGKKFNFIRYSVEAAVPVSEQNDQVENDDMNAEEKRNSSLLDGENTLVEDKGTDEKTPTKTCTDDRPSNYLSPFVSVTRGKVSLKAEKEKRNSVYLQHTNDTIPNSSPKYSVEVRRTLEAIRYFRKQLQNEINRLHQVCDIWDAYKSENLEKIKNANGEDMINVTIGQTRLLTSKKFMQFKGLIDRCEAGATGIGAVEYDGSEDTKPITSGDLEGFWSMLGLQVVNLDKRFDNLNRWKLNDWVDPDEVKPKIKKNLTGVKKTKTAAPGAKAKPSLALQQMLRKMQAEMRKNKNKHNENNDFIVHIPPKQKQRSSTNGNKSIPRKSTGGNTSRRLSIVVKDRKYFSPVATVIKISSPNRRSSSQDSLNLRKTLEKYNEALDTLQSSVDLRKSVLLNGSSRRMSINPQSPMLVSMDSDSNGPSSSRISLSSQSPTQHSPVPTGRKSILKTPGTIKGKSRNVIFNEKLRVKKFNFLIDEDDNTANFKDDYRERNVSNEEALAQMDEDEPQRTLTLRNRKVRCRPSWEIVIPE